MVFSGQVASSGTPLTGTHSLAMNLWRAPSTGNAQDRVCEGSTQSVDFDAGSFQLTIDAACADVFSHYTQVWYELVVDGTAFPLEQVGSVPFAKRSMNAPANGSRLSLQRTVTYGADGYRGPPVDGDIYDNQRNEDCYVTDTDEGGTRRLRCLPAAFGWVAFGEEFDMSAFYLDPTCQTHLPDDGYMYGLTGGFPQQDPPDYPYVVTHDGSRTVLTGIWPATSEESSPYGKISARARFRTPRPFASTRSAPRYRSASSSRCRTWPSDVRSSPRPGFRMTIRRRASFTSATAAVAILGFYSVVHADTPFPGVGEPPMFFSGQVASSGAPLTGTHSLAMNLWRAPSTGNAQDRVCEGSTQSVDFDAGSFELMIDTACADVFSRYTQVWYELVVDGTAFPLEQVGSVPFAKRSMNAPAAGSRLSTHKTMTYGADGYRGPPVYSVIRDDARNENCFVTDTDEGGTRRLRCLPAGFGWIRFGEEFDTSIYFLDGACSQSLPTDGYRYARTNGGPDAPQSYDYVVTHDGSRTVLTAIWEATSEVIPVFMMGGGFPLSCVPFNTGFVRQYTVGAEVPFTEFVEMQDLAE